MNDNKEHNIKEIRIPKELPLSLGFEPSPFDPEKDELRKRLDKALLDKELLEKELAEAKREPLEMLDHLGHAMGALHRPALDDVLNYIKGHALGAKEAFLAVDELVKKNERAQAEARSNSKELDELKKRVAKFARALALVVELTQESTEV